MTDNMLTALNTAAADAQDDGIRFELQIIAANFEYAIDQFRSNPSSSLLETMVGEWAHGVHMMQKSKEYNEKKRLRLGR